MANLRFISSSLNVLRLKNYQVTPAMPDHAWTCSACLQRNPGFTEVCRDCDSPAPSELQIARPITDRAPISPPPKTESERDKELPRNEIPSSLFVVLAVGLVILFFVSYIFQIFSGGAALYFSGGSALNFVFTTFGPPILMVGSILVLVCVATRKNDDKDETKD